MYVSKFRVSASREACFIAFLADIMAEQGDMFAAFFCV
jgi:hypothetical protein